MRQRAFTLLELLVVITIMVLLMAIAMPTITQAIDTAQMVSCQSNMKQVQNGWLLFVMDNQRRLPIGQPGGSHGQSNAHFVTAGNDYYDIASGSLYPLLGSNKLSDLETMDHDKREDMLARDPAVKIFKCAADPHANKRTYSIVGPMHGEGWESPSQSGTDRLTNIVNPAKQVVFVEEADYRSNYNVGSWLMRVTESTKWHWIDYVAPFHVGRTTQNMAFADGHVEAWRWQDDVTLDAAAVGFSYAGKGYTATHNPPFYQVDHSHGMDWARMRAAYRQLREDPANDIKYYRNAEAIQ